jgi:hypothetical protein
MGCKNTYNDLSCVGFVHFFCKWILPTEGELFGLLPTKCTVITETSDITNDFSCYYRETINFYSKNDRFLIKELRLLSTYFFPVLQRKHQVVFIEKSVRLLLKNCLVITGGRSVITNESKPPTNTIAQKKCTWSYFIPYKKGKSKHTHIRGVRYKKEKKGTHRKEGLAVLHDSMHESRPGPPHARDGVMAGPGPGEASP